MAGSPSRVFQRDHKTSRASHGTRNRSTIMPEHQTPSPDSPVGTVLGLAVRPNTSTPLQLHDSLSITVEHGIDHDHGKSKRRGITLLSQTQWLATLSDLGVSVDDLPWTTRRANVLIDAPTLEHLIGKTILVGNVRIEILAETKPCDLMDQQHQGLMQALTPDCRGGVYGRILNDGTVRIGDAVRINPTSPDA